MDQPISIPKSHTICPQCGQLPKMGEPLKVIQGGSIDEVRFAHINCASNN